MKNLLRAAAAVIVSLSSVITAFAEPVSSGKYSFSDIATPQYEWAADSIEEMSRKGLINGYEDGTFRPDNDVTRLECLSLFSRAMGSSDEINSELIQIAKDEYADTLAKYSLAWGKDEIAFLLYKGALKPTDLDTYIKGSEKDTAMKRYEAAIIITKAMGGENEALSEQGAVFDYTDARSIPNNAIQYVSYVSEREIMRGMDDGSFSPDNTVSRSQMAVMLSRVVDATNYSFVKAKLTGVDTAQSNVSSKGSNGAVKLDGYTDNTVMRVAGIETRPKDMIIGVDAIFTYSNGVLAAVDTLSSMPDETVTGKFSAYASNNGKLSVTITPVGKSEGVTYACTDDVALLFNNSPAKINNFSKEDYVSADVVNGKITKLSGSSKTTTVKGMTIEDITIDETALTIKVGSADKEYDGKTFDVSSIVSVTKNGKKSDMSEVYKGDGASITFQYGTVIKIEAVSKTSTVEGTISSLTIASSPSMVVNVKGVDIAYDIPNNCAITINGEEGTLYDFRVGDRVTITTESSAITSIKAETTQVSAGAVEGVIVAINTSYGFINILPDGSAVAQTVYCKDAQTKFITTEGISKKMSDLENGMTVKANGKVSNGAFSGTLIVIQE